MDALDEKSVDAAKTPEPERTWPVTLELRTPIDGGNSPQRGALPPITSLTFRKGRAGDMKGIKLTAGEVSASDLLTIASRMAGVAPGVIEHLDVDDCGEVMALALDFYGRFLATGPRPSRT